MPWLFFFPHHLEFLLIQKDSIFLPCSGESVCLPIQQSLHCPSESAVAIQHFLCLCRTDSWPSGFDRVLWNVGRLVEMFSVLLTSVCCAYIHLASDLVCSRSPLSSETLCHQKHLPGCLGSAKWGDLEDLALGWTGAGRDRSSERTLGYLSSVTKVL